MPAWYSNILHIMIPETRPASYGGGPSREKMEGASRREGRSTPAPWRIPTETGIHAYIIARNVFDGTAANECGVRGPRGMRGLLHNYLKTSVWVSAET